MNSDKNNQIVFFSNEKLQLNRFRITGPKSSVNLLSLLNDYPCNDNELKTDCFNIKEESVIKG